MPAPVNGLGKLLASSWEHQGKPGWACSPALRQGCRGLAGGSSLILLLAERRGGRNDKELPPLTEEKILAWAQAHYLRVGRWPNGSSGVIADAPGESWNAVDSALHKGRRGLPGGSSFARLLATVRKSG